MELRGYRVLFSAFALMLIIGGCVGAARAASGPGDSPIYSPATKSYFQMVKSTGRHGNWPEALEQVRGLTYKGVRGRLAVINSPEAHEFVMRNFDVSHPTWIGLRYWCEFRMLEWVGLRPFSPTDPDRFQLWHSEWSRGNQGCPPSATGPDGYMGVYYRPLGDQNVRWQAARIGKGFGRLLVEYPTGGE